MKLCQAAFAIAAMIAVFAACSSEEASTATPRGTSTPTPEPTVAPGHDAWVSVSVATVWHSPDAVRDVDQPALENPVRIRDWLAISVADRADLEGRADSQALLGDRVSVLAIDGDWAQVVVPDQATPLDSRGYPGWVPVRQLSALAPRPSGDLMTVLAKTAWLKDADGKQVMEIGFGTTLPVYEDDHAISKVGLPDGKTLFMEDVAAEIYCANSPALTPVDQVLPNFVGFYVGTPYLSGGTSGFGFDSAGFVYQIYRFLGVAVPRDAAAQEEAGTAVSRDELQPGDLVYFDGGYGIYIGAGEVVYAPKSGPAVRQATMDAKTFAGARRVLTLQTARPPAPPGTRCGAP
jgi:Cell wall-associated hydrolases (invasion-associated proteins)